MPGRPLRLCTYPGCGESCAGKVVRCEKHQPKKWEKHGQGVKRMTGDGLRKARRLLFQANPLCVHCQQKSPPQVRLATERDHIVPLEEGGQDVPENTQGLCAECHAVKSLAERQRGLKRYLASDT